MDLQSALIAIAIAIVAAGSVAAVSLKVLGAMLTSKMSKLESAPDEKTVQSMISIATLQLEQKVQSEIQMTRHDLRTEMTNQLLPLNVKMEEYSKQLTQLLIGMGALSSAVSHLPKRRLDLQQEGQQQHE